MPDPKQHPKPDESPPAERKKGGFGEFSEVYRARWAANHPNMRPRTYSDPAGAPPEPRLPAEAADERHDDGGTKPPRADD